MVEDLLRTVGPFVDLEAEERRRLSEHFRERTLATGAQVYIQGDPSDALYVVLQGRVAVYRDQPGRPLQLRARHGPGDFFGELGLFDGAPRSASARASEPTRLLVIAKADLIAFLEDHPSVAIKLQIAAARRHTQNVSDALALGERQEVRIRLAQAVEISLSNGCRQPAVLENLSPGGLCLTGAPAGWERHWTVRFDLLHGDACLPVSGRVTWRSKDTIGLAFLPTTPEHDERVQRLLRKLIEETTGPGREPY